MNQLKKIRVDQLLLARGLADTRSRAQSLILAGVVYSGTQRIEKSSQMLLPNTPLSLKGKDHPYVSRGGLKLKAALDYFKFNITGKTCLDVGASTGGFTDCLLKAGAKKVYALDVGYGQIDWSLRTDPRVVVLERVNFRHFDTAQIQEPIGIATMDVSFISITQLLPKVIQVFKHSLSAENQIFVALIKPQFEVGKGEVGKKGVVKDKQKQQECVVKITACALKHGFQVLGTIPSPVLGQDGNQEYLMAAELLRAPV